MRKGERGEEGRRDMLLRVLREGGGPASVNDVMRRAGIHPGERTAVKRELRDLARDGVLTRDGNRFAVAGVEERPRREERPRQPFLSGTRGPLRKGKGLLGTLTRHRDGFGFVARVDRKGDDVFVPPDEARKALDGDLVRIEVVPGTRGRSAGRIVEVVERRRRLVIGTYHARGRSSFVVPSTPEIEGVVPVAPSELARDGEVVKVALAPGQGALEGTVIERIGEPGEPRVEVLKVAYAKGFSDVFPEDVLADASEVPDRVRPEDRRGRRDLTALPLVTIDGEDARDFDDAVHVERLPGKKGYRLVVAIADVAHYVHPGTALDAEAVRRATSVYFPMQVLPMLPERLSNGICSLNPDVDRLCMVADLRLDARGHVLESELYEAVMRSHARCTYDEVARVLAGEKVEGRERFRDAFELMGELQAKLTAMRRRRGAIDFDLPEAKIVLDAGGRVTSIERRPRNRAHRVVEEFMLAANEAVARHFGEQDIPTIYRVHGTPDAEKLQGFLDLARTHGFEVPDVDEVTPAKLNALLEQFEAHPQQRALNQLLLRAMMQAVYSPENIGHYGLAAPHYLHFTSPIRRYPDLMVHRLLKQEWARGSGAHPHGPPRDLEEFAALSSERERAAMQAEREIASYYAAVFVQDKVGERFEGVVASVVEFGLFVELERFFVEGLVKIEDLGDAIEYDAQHHALVDASSGRAWRVGDEVEVEVVSASPARRQIDLALVEGGQLRRGAERSQTPRDGLRMRPRRDRGTRQERRPSPQAHPGKRGRDAVPPRKGKTGGKPGRGRKSGGGRGRR